MAVQGVMGRPSTMRGKEADGLLVEVEEETRRAIVLSGFSFSLLAVNHFFCSSIEAVRFE